MVGYIFRNNVMTTPIIGYNTNLPQKLGLYRMLSAIVFREATNLCVDLNLSSGASNFKILRGGKPYIEYTAIYRKHLSKTRQAMILALRAALLKIGVPIMQKLQL